MKLRTFLALDFPPEILRVLTLIQEKYKKLVPQAKWVRSSNIHLTLHFLGDISEADVALIIKELREPLTNKSGVLAKLGEPGVFPSWDNPRVLWLSLAGKLPPLYDLHNVTLQTLVKNGFTLVKRDFCPHITLARISAHKRSISLDRSVINKLVPGQGQEFKLDKLTLYTSKLTPTGPVYTKQHTFLLQ